MSKYVNAEMRDFLLLPLAVLDNPGAFKPTTIMLWGKSMPAGHDYLGGNFNALNGSGVGGLTIVGPDGRIISGKGTPSTAYLMTSSFLPSVEEAVRDHGLLAGLTPPQEAAKVRYFLRLASYSDALREVKKLDDGPFKDTLTERIQALAVEKKRVFDVFVEEGKMWEAYRVGTSYVKCFSREKNVSQVRSALAKIKADRAVKNELAARKAYGQLIARVSSMSTQKQCGAIIQMLPSLMEKYPDAACTSVMEEVLKKAKTPKKGGAGC